MAIHRNVWQQSICLLSIKGTKRALDEVARRDSEQPWDVSWLLMMACECGEGSFSGSCSVLEDRGSEAGHQEDWARSREAVVAGATVVSQVDVKCLEKDLLLTCPRVPPEQPQPHPTSPNSPSPGPCLQRGFSCSMGATSVLACDSAFEKSVQELTVFLATLSRRTAAHRLWKSELQNLEAWQPPGWEQGLATSTDCTTRLIQSQGWTVCPVDKTPSLFSSVIFFFFH